MSIYHISRGKDDIVPESYKLNVDDPSLNEQKASALKHEYNSSPQTLNQLFFSKYHLEYLTEYCWQHGVELRVLTYPCGTKTCYEKASILGVWDPLNVIKTFYLESSIDHSLYAVVIPETGCFIDKTLIKEQLELNEDEYLLKAQNLPHDMDYGTCSPFITKDDLQMFGGKVKYLIFDTETLILKKHENSLDDFSFGLDDHFSVQMNYYQCFKMLKKHFHHLVIDKEVLNLSFKEKFVRKKGVINVSYQFKTLNYRTARFINSIHGYGDVSITNDHIDELNLPDILTLSKTG